MKIFKRMPLKHSARKTLSPNILRYDIGVSTLYIASEAMALRRAINIILYCIVQCWTYFRRRVETLI